MNKKVIMSAAALLLASGSALASNGVVLGATRVVYNGESKEASLTVENHSDNKQYFLIQAWVDDKDGNKNVPFSVTPPLFRLNANKENMLRIVKTGEGLPSDRESVYWMNVKAIPPAPAASEQNVLQLAIKTRIKLFYRPSGLPGKVTDAPGALQWSVQGGDLVAKNPSAYSVTLDSVKIGGTEVKNVNLVMPKSEAHYKLPAGAPHSGQVSFTTVNDYGGNDPVRTAALH